MPQNEDDLDLDIESKPKSGGMKKILIIVLASLLVVGGVVATTVVLMSSHSAQAEDEEAYFADDEEPDAAKKKKRKKKHRAKSHKKKKEHKSVSKHRTPHYLELDKPIVVNLDGSSGVRFLQVSVALMSYDEKNIEKLKTNMPVIRHNLVLLFSSQNFANLQSIEGKKRLKESALKLVQEELKKLVGEPLVDDMYLPSIVGQ